ncbi:MAG: hypothetical protein KF870_06250 [Leadbetterella sp.]|nr:hypothetical protein [Leadbetterella sp.]
MNKIDFTYLSGLLGVSLGWLLNEVSLFLRSRGTTRKIKKQVLFNLLEVLSILKKYDSESIKEVVVAELLKIAPKEPTSQELVQLNKILVPIMQSLVYDFIKDNLKGLESKYMEAIDILSTIDPITAYRLSGNVRVYRVFDSYKKHFESVSEESQDNSNNQKEAFQEGNVLFEKSIASRTVSDLKSEILKIAFSIGIKTWFHTKKIINLFSELDEEETQQISQFLINIIEKSDHE